MHPADLVYQTVLRAAPAALRLAAPFSDKLSRGLAGRRDTLDSLRLWATKSRTPDAPLVWLHAPSVGEALMAQAILTALRESEPRLQAVFTFFSPSAERVAARVGADWHGYLPWDRPADMSEALHLAQPGGIAFVRTEIWPVLVRLARQRGVPCVLLNAVLAEGSSRTGRGARLLLGRAYRRLDAVGAVSADDAARFPRLGVAADRIHVTGDARFDQVRRRVEALDRDTPLLRALRAGPGPILVAGSTWAADEERLLPALAALARPAGADALPSQQRRWRVIIAPHEPTPAHVAALEQRLEVNGFAHARLPHDGAVPDVGALVVDRVGVLADLYAVADVAYVGGGFGSAGLHSVVEPAALGVPVLYGPRHGNAQEAARLEQAGGGFVVRDATGLRQRLATLLDEPAARAAAAAAAHAFVMTHTGGASRNAELLLRRLRS